jgi:hypothetical protein
MPIMLSSDRCAGRELLGRPCPKTKSLAFNALAGRWRCAGPETLPLARAARVRRRLGRMAVASRMRGSKHRSRPTVQGGGKRPTPVVSGAGEQPKVRVAPARAD